MFYMQHLPKDASEFAKNLKSIKEGEPIGEFDTFLAKVSSKWG